MWKTCSSEVAETLKGHTGAVVSLVVGAKRLYSGSMDKTIKVNYLYLYMFFCSIIRIHTFANN